MDDVDDDVDDVAAAPDAAIVLEAGEDEALLVDNDGGDEEDDEEEEDYFDEDSIGESPQFQRFVHQLPPISTLDDANADHGSRFIDFGVLMNDIGSSDSDEDGSSEGDADDVEPGESQKRERDSDVVVAELGRGAGEADEAADKVEDEIDGVPFSYKPAVGGRRSINSLIESLQTKQGRKALGYDYTDPLINDEDLNDDEESNSALLDTQHAYGYDDFRVTTENAPQPELKKKDATGTQPNKKAVVKKPLKDLQPPATEELKNAIENFREQAKALHSKLYPGHEVRGRVQLPPELSDALLRLGRAIGEWHPKKHVKGEIFEYVSDVVPPNIIDLKDKAKRMMASKTSDAATPVVVPDDVPLDDGGGGGGEMEADAMLDREAMAAELARLHLELHAVIREALAAELDSMRVRAEKELDANHKLYFKWNDEMLQLAERMRAMTSTLKGNKGVSALYAEIASWFPEGFMDNKRVQHVVHRVRSKQNSAARSKGTAGTAPPEAPIPAESTPSITRPRKKPKN